MDKLAAQLTSFVALFVLATLLPHDWPAWLYISVVTLGTLAAGFGSGPWWHKLAVKRGWPLHDDRDEDKERPHP